MAVTDNAYRDANAAAIGEALHGFTPVGAPVTNANLATAYTVVFPAGTTRAIIQVFSQNVRMAFGGAVPTSSAGFQKTPADGAFEVYATSAPQIIQEAATATAYIQAGY